MEVHLDYCLEAADPKYWTPTVSYRNKWTADLAAPMYFENSYQLSIPCVSKTQKTPQKHIYNSHVLNLFLPSFPTEYSPLVEKQVLHIQTLSPKHLHSSLGNLSKLHEGRQSCLRKRSALDILTFTCIRNTMVCKLNSTVITNICLKKAHKGEESLLAFSSKTQYQLLSETTIIPPLQGKIIAVS